LYIHTPIITASDCEGAGEMFAVTTALPQPHEPVSKGKLLSKIKHPKSEEEKKRIAEEKAKLKAAEEEKKAAEAEAAGKKPKKDKK
jgi:asparaginyl-tRNA synthetase